MTFARGDRVKVEFEGVVDSLSYGGVDVKYNGTYYWFEEDEGCLTKIEKVYPAGSVWVHYNRYTVLSATTAVEPLTTSQFCHRCGISEDQIVAIHEPEAKP